MRYFFATVVLAATMPSAAHAQPLQDGREAAHSAYVAGQYGAARTILLQMLDENPDDADLLRRLAAVEAAREDLRAAQNLIDRAYALAPHDADIQIARANILLWRGEEDAARAMAEQVRIVSPDYPGLAQFTLAADRAAANRRIRIRAASIGGSVSHVDFRNRNSTSWTVQRAGAVIGQREGALLTLVAEREDRGPIDTRLAGRLDFPSGENRFFFQGSATPGADFREDWSAGAGAEFAAAGPTTFLLDGRLARYRTGDVGVIGAGIRQRIGPQLSLTGRTINLFGGGKDYRFGGSLRADYEQEEGPGLFAIVASYPDTEADGTRQLRAVAGGVRIDMGRDLAMRLSGEYENRDQSYERIAVGVDVTLNLTRP